ncbi:MAG: PIN domain nuclease [Chloroflexi bacterium]|nr:MAG: PIN domain nuclease [Chloroflexota bacterium]
MSLLLDTHVFLWVVIRQTLSDRATDLFFDPENELFLSAASYWEICIKRSIGKLALDADWVNLFNAVIVANEISWLPITQEHCQRITTLPMLHGDPFDRLLIAQALCEEMTLLTADANIMRYDVLTLW